MGSSPMEPMTTQVRLCSIDDCERRSVTRGWCGTHYKRWQVHGNPTTTLQQRRGPLPDIHSPTALGNYLRVSRQRAHQLLHAEEQYARNRFREVFQRGLIPKPALCMICETKTTDLEAHHSDYAYPLAVIWVCTSCHTRVHPHHPGSRNGAT